MNTSRQAYRNRWLLIQRSFCLFFFFSFTVLLVFQCMQEGIFKELTMLHFFSSFHSSQDRIFAETCGLQNPTKNILVHLFCLQPGLEAARLLWVKVVFCFSASIDDILK